MEYERFKVLLKAHFMLLRNLHEQPPIYRDSVRKAANRIDERLQAEERRDEYFKMYADEYRTVG